jgi:hypothetical protein
MIRTGRSARRRAAPLIGPGGSCERRSSRYFQLPAAARSPFDDGAVERTYTALQAFLREADSLFSPGHPPEGIVFHHPDGRRAKIKRKDFPVR